MTRFEVECLYTDITRDLADIQAKASEGCKTSMRVIALHNSVRKTDVKGVAALNKEFNEYAKLHHKY
jgi:hypothetical protein